MDSVITAIEYKQFKGWGHYQSIIYVCKGKEVEKECDAYEYIRTCNNNLFIGLFVDYRV